VVVEQSRCCSSGSNRHQAGDDRSALAAPWSPPLASPPSWMASRLAPWLGPSSPPPPLVRSAQPICFNGPASRARFAYAQQVLGSARDGSSRRAAMTKWLGGAIVILILPGGAAAMIRPTAAASISAERRLERARERLFPRRDRFAYRPEAQPRYYGRPIY